MFSKKVKSTQKGLPPYSLSRQGLSEVATNPYGFYPWVTLGIPLGALLSRSPKVGFVAPGLPTEVGRARPGGDLLVCTSWGVMRLNCPPLPPQEACGKASNKGEVGSDSPRTHDPPPPPERAVNVGRLVPPKVPSMLCTNRIVGTTLGWCVCAFS